MIDAVEAIDAIKVVPVLEDAQEQAEAAQNITPEADPAALVILIPEGMREIRLDAASLDLWLDVLEWQYKSLPRGDLADMLTGGLKVFARLALFGLKRYPQAGWLEQPARERHADILPYTLRYIAQNVFANVARKHPRFDLGAVMTAQAAAALLKAQAVKDGIPGGLPGALARHAATAAAGLPAAASDARGASQASGAGTGAASGDASGSQGGASLETGEQERKPGGKPRRRAFGIRSRGK